MAFGERARFRIISAFLAAVTTGGCVYVHGGGAYQIRVSLPGEKRTNERSGSPLLSRY